MHAKKPASARRAPRQARAKATVEAILKAAAQILEVRGEAGFDTNRIARKAGVSIGTLYQYFPDKAAILATMNRREQARLREQADALYGARDAGSERIMLHSFIHAFEDQPAVRRAVVRAAIQQQSAEEMGVEIERTTRLMPPYDGMSRLDAFVMTRAVTGIVRAAVLEGSDLLLKPEFEEALLTLTRAYRMARASRRSGSAGPAKAKPGRGRASLSSRG